MGNYSGERNNKYLALIDEDYYNNSKQKSLNIYDKFSTKDEDKQEFKIPDYSVTLNLK